MWRDASGCPSAWSRSSSNSAGTPGTSPRGTTWPRRKPEIVAQHERAMRALLDGNPDLTLKELRQALGLECSLQAIHVVLEKMGLTLMALN